MDTFLSIASLRTIRSYATRPIAPDTVDRIIDAGRVTGSGYNRQPWRFIVIQDPQILQATAVCVNRPSNLAAAALAIGVLLTEDTALSRFDAGRCAENMMLAAWSEGVGSSPNHVHDLDQFRQILGLDEMIIATILSFGYPKSPPDPGKHSPQEWVDKADRKPKGGILKREWPR